MNAAESPARDIPILKTRTTAPATIPVCSNSLQPHSRISASNNARFICHSRLRSITNDTCAIHLEPKQHTGNQQENKRWSKLRAPFGLHHVLKSFPSCIAIWCSDLGVSVVWVYGMPLISRVLNGVLRLCVIGIGGCLVSIVRIWGIVRIELSHGEKGDATRAYGWERSREWMRERLACP